ncbi:MAG: hypothetical protein SOX25_00180, partial [Eubacteriales bacterium]|nr:hypothetical protein [Eubacteriales bacterium]
MSFFANRAPFAKMNIVFPFLAPIMDAETSQKATGKAAFAHAGVKRDSQKKKRGSAQNSPEQILISVSASFFDLPYHFPLHAH